LTPEIRRFYAAFQLNLFMSLPKSKSDVGAGEKTMARHRRQLEKLEGQMEELRRKTLSAFRKVDGVRGTRRTKVGTKKMATKSRTAAQRKLRGL
jgi:hypothetical protein